MGPERIYPPRLREEQAAEEARRLAHRRRQRFTLFLLVGLVLTTLLGFLLYGLFSRVTEGGEVETAEGAYVLPAGEYVQVDVLNGCEVEGVAEVVSGYLRDAGFDIPSYGNAPEPEPFSLVIDRVGDSLSSLRVAHALGISPDRIVQRIDSSRFVKATVVIGRDYRKLTPFE